MKVNPTILLTFDVEEFDLPLEYNKEIDLSQQFAIGNKGFAEVERIVTDFNIKTTMFTTARFALQCAEQIKRLSVSHEIASHTFSHSTFEKTDLLKSKLVLEDITGKEVTGLRMPRMKKVNIEWVKEAGYSYDSSINPTLIPGRYNNLHIKRVFYKEAGMLRLPISVSPNFRIPLF
ncbi:MAG: polysaccharide deacetylase family protein, partial [Sphingobacteriales bacterium]|nr:polysaccharide deacetylase family protein [Sphingobacteriales bacterium]